MVCILLCITINKGGRFSVTTTIMISRFIYVYLCLRHEGVSKSGGIALAFLTSAPDGEWSNLRSGRFNLPNPGAHLIGWMGPRTRLDAAEKRNIPAFAGN
jgi:hypothetical protein